ncbi:MAG: hypothetical protein ACLGIR_02685 [Actinomycetes bacterium]
MPTRRSRRGDTTASDRRQVGLTVPRRVKAEMTRAAGVLEWSVGDWVLAVAAEHGPALRRALTGGVAKRHAVEDATFCALYLTGDERDELDDQAVACGLNRSAFVTAVAQLGLGEGLGDVVAQLTGTRPVGEGGDGSSGSGSTPPSPS